MIMVKLGFYLISLLLAFFCPGETFSFIPLAMFFFAFLVDFLSYRDYFVIEEKRDPFLIGLVLLIALITSGLLLSMNYAYVLNYDVSNQGVSILMPRENSYLIPLPILTYSEFCWDVAILSSVFMCAYYWIDKHIKKKIRAKESSAQPKNTRKVVFYL